MKSRTLLVIVAHPDDESFPMGGTLAKYAAQGVRVVLVSATRGEAGIPGLDLTATACVREAELRAAAQMLGIARLEFLGYVDGHLAEANAREAVSKLTALLNEERPDVVITFGPDGISGHPDHVMVHRWATAAFGAANLSGQLFYVMPSEATQQGCGVPPSEAVAGGPVAAIDVGAYLVTKVRATQCHASQKPPFPGTPEEEAVRLACHEYFVLARPATAVGVLSDLFAEEEDVVTDEKGTYSDSQ
jgi:LmbE family N-acetylglucosaminyl deacetylase